MTPEEAWPLIKSAADGIGFSYSTSVESAQYAYEEGSLDESEVAITVLLASITGELTGLRTVDQVIPLPTGLRNRVALLRQMEDGLRAIDESTRWGSVDDRTLVHVVRDNLAGDPCATC